MGLQASLPQAASPPVVVDPPETVIVHLAPDGSLWINQSAVKLDDLRGSLERIVSSLRALIVLLSF
jgi:biopolymer transport protein ExbD